MHNAKSQPRMVRLEELDEETLAYWEKEYWRLISDNDAKNEQEFEERFAAARRKGFLPRDLFEDCAKWKSRQRLDLIRNNSGDKIRKCTQKAFQAKTRKDAIASLVALDGVALRRAVALLHWMRPTAYPMIDKRVVRQIGWHMPANWEDVAYYERFADHLSSHASRLSVDLRTLDRALWAMDKASGVKLSGRGDACGRLSDPIRRQWKRADEKRDGDRNMRSKNGNKIIRATILDCNAKRIEHERRSIDIYIDEYDVKDVGWTPDYPIKVTLDDERIVQSTIAYTSWGQWWLRRTSPDRTRNGLPEWLRGLGMDHEGKIDFEILAHDHIKFVQVVDLGRPHPERV